MTLLITLATTALVFGQPRRNAESIVPKAGHELTCGSPGSVPAGHVGSKTDTWIDLDPWETGTRTRRSGFGRYFRGSYLQVLAGIVNIY